MGEEVRGIGPERGLSVLSRPERVWHSDGGGVETGGPAEVGGEGGGGQGIGALGSCLLVRIGAAEEVFLAVIGTMIDCKFGPESDGLNRRDIRLIRVSVPANFDVGPVGESVIGAAAPAVGERKISVDNHAHPSPTRHRRAPIG